MFENRAEHAQAAAWLLPQPRFVPRFQPFIRQLCPLAVPPPGCSAPRGNSIYVTASRNLSEDGGTASGEGSRAASRASAGSPRSRSPSPGSPLSRASSSLSRQLNVPWALPRAGSARRGDMAAAARAQQDQHAVGQMAALLEASGPEGSEEGLAAGYLGMSEEEALQRALEMSLQETRHRTEQQQSSGTDAGAGADDGSAAARQQGQKPQAPGQGSAAAQQGAGHVEQDAPTANNGGGGQRNPPYGGSSGADVPATE